MPDPTRRPSWQLAARLDWTVYLVTDSELAGGVDRVPAVVAEAVRGGAQVVQVRDKHAEDAEVAELVRACRAAIATAVGPGAAQEVALFVDDRLEVAVELGCHLHVGQSDVPVERARRALGDRLLLGLSVSDEDQARRGAAGGEADVYGIGPVAATSTKPDAAAALGLAGTARCLAALRPAGVPAPRAVAIGGVDAARAEALGALGVDGVCAVSAIMAAASPRAAARTLREAVLRGRENRFRSTAPGDPAPGTAP